jgi:CRISPR-associated protein Cas2
MNLDKYTIMPNIDHLERLKRIRAAGLATRFFRGAAADTLALLPISERISQLLNYLQQHQPTNTYEMIYFVMYDIEDNRIRRTIAKYLQRKGCIRMQKSIFLGSGTLKTFREIGTALREINSMYNNNDSIMLLPVTQDLMHQLNMIGKDVDFKLTVAPPKLLII